MYKQQIIILYILQIHQTLIYKQYLFNKIIFQYITLIHLLNKICLQNIQRRISLNERDTDRISLLFPNMIFGISELILFPKAS